MINCVIPPTYRIHNIAVVVSWYLMQLTIQPKMERTKRKLPLTTKYWAPSFLQASWFWTPTSIMAILIAKFTKDTIGPPNAPNEGLKRRQLWFERNIWIFTLKILILTHFQTYWILCFFLESTESIRSHRTTDFLFSIKKKSRFSRIWNPHLSRGARLRRGYSPFFYVFCLDYFFSKSVFFRSFYFSLDFRMPLKVQNEMTRVKKGCESL